MQQVCDLADKWKVHCYLECAGNGDFRPNFYAKFGFEESLPRIDLEANNTKVSMSVMSRWFKKWL